MAAVLWLCVVSLAIAPSVAVPHRSSAGVRFAEVMELSTQPVGPGPAERVLRPGEGIAFDISDKW